MQKTIDLDTPVFTLVKTYPELKQILKDAGLTGITNPATLATIGRTISLRQGMEMKQLEADAVISALQKEGFIVNDRKAALKSMIARLNQGEDPEKVREDFVRQFESVTVQEIMDVEQEMINEGTSETEIQSLCDLHSALFHGKTEAEVLAEEMEAAKPWLVRLLEAENYQLQLRIASLKTLLEHPKENFDKIKEILEDLKALKSHYMKKEELIMPGLYAVGVTGPTQVMWGVDDEILRETGRIFKTMTPENIEEKKPALLAVLTRMQEMIYKEESILYPMAAAHLDESEWLKTYPDIDEYGLAWLEDFPKWEKGEKWHEEHPFEWKDMEIETPTGTINLEQLQRMLDVLPVDITYIDENDNLIFFTNEGKVFARPHSALGRDVILCHPPRIVPIVKNMLADFKAGKKDRVERWIPNQDNPVKVVYQAVYDKDGKYKGTVETVQKFGEDKKTLEKFIR